MADRLAVIQAQESIDELKRVEDSIKSVIKTTKDLIKNANNISKALKTGTPREYTRALREMNTATKEFNKSQVAMANNMTRITRLERQVAQMLREQSRAIREVANATRDESRAREAAERIATQQQRTARETANAQAAENRANREAANALNAESRARQQATREQRQNERQTRESTSAHALLTRQVREARQRARDYGAEIINLNERLRSGSITQREYRTQVSQLERNFRNTTREGNRLQQQLNRLNQATTPAGQRNGSLWGRVTDIVKGLSIANILNQVSSAIMNLGNKAVGTAIQLDTLRLAQLSVFKTSSEVAKQNDFLTGISERYGIEILSLTDAYTKFAASSAGTLLEGQKTQKIFDSVTRSSALLGVSTDETNGILRALGQMMSKGKVQAEELRGQLGDRMAGAFKLFADGMGVSTSQLDAMLKKGEVLAEDVLPKFAAQLDKKYTLEIGDDIETNQANLNRISNAWVEFVDSVELKSGVVSKSIRAITVVFTDFLNLLSPSKEVSIIEQQQQQFNELGVQLRQNWKDQNARKEIMDKMIEINPFFLNGLDKEKTSLEEISKRIQDVNAQYFQKIILQEKEDEITELVKDQALNYRRLAEILSENAEKYNAAGNEAKTAIDKFANGSINYEEALKRIYKEEGISADAKHGSIRILRQLNQVYKESRGSVFNYVGSIKANNEAIKIATGQYNGLNDAANRLFSGQGQLLNMNGMLAKSFNSVGSAVYNQRKVIEEQLKVAEGQGRKYALINNVWREQDAKSGKWKTTNKRQDANNDLDLKGQSTGWYLEGNQLVQRQIQVLEKTEKKKASSLSSIQKDHLKDLQAIRDTRLAENETSFEKEKISEIKYLDEILRINTEFYNKKMGYLKGKNAEERKQIADADLDQAKLVKSIGAKKTEVSKKAFEDEAKVLEENYKIQSNILERNSEDLENISFVSGVARIDRQIEIDNESIQKAEEYHKELIRLAKKANQETIDLERKRDEEIGQLEDKRSERFRSRYEAALEDLNVQNEFKQGLQNLTFEQQRSVVLANKKLSIEEKGYELNILDKQNQININKIEIERLKTLRSQLLTKIAVSQVSGFINPNDAQEVSKLDGIIKGLENANVEIDIDIASSLSPQMEKTKEIVSQGLNDLGLENLANQFDAVFQKIIDGSFSAKDAALLAASAIADGLTAINNKTKENTIAALDEQLKYTQETTEQEIGFINGRLEQLNALDTLTKEQMTERNRLEDEARTYKEQQMQREKMIEAQKARAEQKAAANQALINGALGASLAIATYPFPASLIPAGLALGFGVAQSIAISSKDVVPKYFVGRQGGKAELAITQDGGREFISNEKGEITSLGSDKGDQLTYLKKGDNVHTAKETKAIINRMGYIPKIGENIFHKIALQSLRAPAPVVINQTVDNSDAIAEKVGRKFENALKKYDKPVVIKNEGKILLYRGANFGLEIGEYDENGNEKYYS